MKFEDPKTGILQNFKIKRVRLDTLTNRADVVKIDVEGAELDVLKGAMEIFKNGAAIICEVHPKEMKTFDHDIWDLFEFIKDFDYNIYRIRENGSLEKICEPLLDRAHYLFSPEEVSI